MSEKKSQTGEFRRRAAVEQARAEWAEFDRALPKGAPVGAGRADARFVAIATSASEASLDALRKAFEALGADWEDVRVVPARRGLDDAADARFLLWEVETIDPELILALGPEAERTASAVWPLKTRPLIALPDPAEALKTPEGKRDLWDRLKPLAPRLVAARVAGPEETGGEDTLKT